LERHQFIEYILARDLVAPYRQLVNKLIPLFEEETYDRKERFIKNFKNRRHDIAIRFGPRQSTTSRF